MCFDRNEWISKRSDDGYDWTPLLLAMSKLKIYGGEEGHGLVVDMSAIAPEFYPTKAQLEPGPDGWWYHDQSGVAGPLFEILSSIVLSCLEGGKPYEPTKPPSAEKREAMEPDGWIDRSDWDHAQKRKAEGQGADIVVTTDKRYGDDLAVYLATPRAGEPVGKLGAMEERLALCLCELGHVPDPRRADLKPLKIHEMPEGNQAFKGKVRQFTKEEIQAILSADKESGE